MDAPNLIPDDSFQPIQGEPAFLIRSHPHGLDCDLTFHFGENRFQNIRMSRRHWEWVQANARSHPCLVCDYKLEPNGPTHLIWSFPPAEPEDYKHWTYMHSSSEISDSLVQCILEFEIGQCSRRRSARLGRI